MTNVDPGSYLIFAKTSIVQTSVSGGGGASAYTRCTVEGDPTAPSSTDDSGETEIGRGDAWEVGRATLQANVTKALASTGSITLRCRYGNNSGSSRTVVARKTKIIALKVDTTSRTAVTG